MYTSSSLPAYGGKTTSAGNTKRDLISRSEGLLCATLTQSEFLIKMDHNLVKEGLP